MNKLIMLFVSAMIFASCSTSKKTTTTATTTQTSTETKPGSTQDGLSYETAIVIQEKHEGEGVSAEYKWLKEHYPGYQSHGQALTTYNKKPFDVISIETADGRKFKVYFDISNFFGKF